MKTDSIMYAYGEITRFGGCLFEAQDGSPLACLL